MLAVGVRGEEEIAREQLSHDAADRPDICYLVPLAAFQDDLGRTVLTSADNRAVWLVEEGGPTEIDHPDLAALWQPIAIALRRILDKLFLLKQNIFRF